MPLNPETTRPPNCLYCGLELTWTRVYFCSRSHSVLFNRYWGKVDQDTIDEVMRRQATIQSTQKRGRREGFICKQEPAG